MYKVGQPGFLPRCCPALQRSFELHAERRDATMSRLSAVLLALVWCVSVSCVACGRQPTPSQATRVGSATASLTAPATPGAHLPVPRTLYNPTKVDRSKVPIGSHIVLAVDEAIALELGAAPVGQLWSVQLSNAKVLRQVGVIRPDGEVVIRALSVGTSLINAMSGPCGGGCTDAQYGYQLSVTVRPGS